MIREVEEYGIGVSYLFYDLANDIVVVERSVVVVGNVLFLVFVNITFIPIYIVRRELLELLVWEALFHIVMVSHEVK